MSCMTCYNIRNVRGVDLVWPMDKQGNTHHRHHCINHRGRCCAWSGDHIEIYAAMHT